jgi:hypothetical protein
MLLAVTESNRWVSLCAHRVHSMLVQVSAMQRPIFRTSESSGVDLAQRGWSCLVRDRRNKVARIHLLSHLRCLVLRVAVV